MSCDRSDIRRGGLAKSKGSVQHGILSCRYDLAELNPKCHNYSIIFTEISFCSETPSLP